MPSRKFFTKFFSYLAGFAALGFFYAGEALAVCCKTSTGCKCTTALTCTSGSKVSSCSTSGGGLNLNKSLISCNLDGATTIFADRGGEASQPGALWAENGLNVPCTRFDSSNNNLGTGFFDLAMEFRMTAPATCDNATGVLKYEAFCGSNVQSLGTMKPTDGTTVAPWVLELCTDAKGQLQDCDLSDGTGTAPRLVLGGFRSQLTNKGPIPDLKKCLTDFPDQTSEGGLPAGQVLLYTEQYAPNKNCTGPRISASDAKRRMCHDRTFYNPDYNETTGAGATNPPCAPDGTLTFRAGFLATDTADIQAAKLFDNQWSLGTLNLSCSNEGTVPSTVVNSANIAVSSFQFPNDGPIVAYVQGKPNDVSPATSATPILNSAGVATGLRITFRDCNGPPAATNPPSDGLDQVICRGIDAASNPKTVNLTISAIQKDGQGLGFIGDAIGVKINNAAANCPLIK